MLDKFIRDNLKKSSPIIGFGLKKFDREIIKSLQISSRFCEIILFGDKNIKNVRGFKKIISNNPEQSLAQALVDKQIDGLVRGTIDDFRTREAYVNLTKRKKVMLELCVLRFMSGQDAVITEPSNGHGWSLKEKIESCSAAIDFLSKLTNFKPKIGCITGIRHETYKRKKKIREGKQLLLNQTYEEAEKIVGYFKKKGIVAKNYSIEIETALQDECNLIVPPNSMVGNLMFRSLVFLGGAKLLISPLMGSSHKYEDNFRNERDFEYHLKWLTAWINSDKGIIKKIK